VLNGDSGGAITTLQTQQGDGGAAKLKIGRRMANALVGR
jgi:hypothetical protein